MTDAHNQKRSTDAAARSYAFRLFADAPAAIQSVARDILRDEREVMHLKRRSDIHQRICEHVKRVIK